MRLSRWSPVIQSAVSGSWRRTSGVAAVAFNKERDPGQKLLGDKIGEDRTKPGIEPTTSWFLVGFLSAVPQRELLDRELFKLQQMYGEVDKTTFPNFMFEDPKFEAIEKPDIIIIIIGIGILLLS
uniref:ATP synthase peripheral stalk subunit F6, mitochondrial n=1 Tax=Sus scrofa TaxID=9823 RepID=A0A8D1PD64_PIG